MTRGPHPSSLGDSAPGGAVRPRPRTGEAGFTLIELMIVIAIIAIIAAIAIPNLLAAKLTSNETATMATMRSIVTAQTQISVAGRIDTDGDGMGEYGTFMEMTGSVGVRTGFNPGPPPASSFATIGPRLTPPVLSTVMASIDANGFVTKAGYAFMIFLPDTGDPALFVHETGPVSSPGLSGAVGVDLSEAYWCAYAQPVAIHNSGNRRFFCSMRGEILQSSNDVAKSGGTSSPIQPQSAFMGAGITSILATGTRGMDGDMWKSAN